MYIKICGLTKSEQAQAIAQMGASALGFICVAASPRYVSPEAITQIISSLAKEPNFEGAAEPHLQNLVPEVQPLDLIGIFLGAGIEQICQTVSQSGLNGIQLHGDESPEFCQQLRTSLAKIEDRQNSPIKLIKALRVKDQDGLTQAQTFSKVVDAVLLDAYDPQTAGGTGKTLDWQMLRDFKLDLPWWLAGGLNPDNIVQAIAMTCPDGVDVSSGVECSTGDKDLLKVKQFIDAVRREAPHY
ncbi:MAG: N-(5'-phosphoribosyl)anthranilate isomerase [Oscillatoriales cyanobacterium CG2_30_44_21]|nr:MAG: N-(5'-phosphoribosyl)anthranilate isomerase [Oscillatoriales cyanobacterium CG2_30_44_21]